MFELANLDVEVLAGAVKKERKSNRARELAAIVELLHAAGWSDDGHTISESVRIPSSRSPVFGGLGGELRTFGGRRRFAKGDRRVTIGPRVVCFYRAGLNGAAPGGFTRFTPRDVEAIKACANEA